MVQHQCSVAMFCSSASTTKEMPKAELFPALSQPRVFPLTWGRALFLPPLPPTGV